MSLTLKELEEGRRIAALVVHYCGENYYPLFARFDREYQKKREAADRINHVLKRDKIGAPSTGSGAS